MRREGERGEERVREEERRGGRRKTQRGRSGRKKRERGRERRRGRAIKMYNQKFNAQNSSCTNKLHSHGPHSYLLPSTDPHMYKM